MSGFARYQDNATRLVNLHTGNSLPSSGHRLNSASDIALPKCAW
jgi:hypothetical protein